MQTTYLLIMHLFLKLRPFKEISLFSILIATLLSYALIYTISSWISLVFIIVACVLFVFHQLFLIGYKTNNSSEASDKQVIDFRQVKYGDLMSFEEKIYMRPDNSHTYYYSEMLIAENVYSIFSIFRLLNLKKHIVNYEKSNLTGILRETNS